MQVYHSRGSDVEFDLYWYGEERWGEIYRALKGNLYDVVKMFKEALKQSISKWGSIALKGGRFRLFHSQPGQPPFQQTGNYYRSIRYDVTPSRELGFIIGEISTDVPYAPALELGGMIQIDQDEKTHTNFRLINPITKPINISARPHWIPLFNELAPKMLDMLARNWRTIRSHEYWTDLYTDVEGPISYQLEGEFKYE